MCDHKFLLRLSRNRTNIHKERAVAMLRSTDNFVQACVGIDLVCLGGTTKGCCQAPGKMWKMDINNCAVRLRADISNSRCSNCTNNAVGRQFPLLNVKVGSASNAFRLKSRALLVHFSIDCELDKG